MKNPSNWPEPMRIEYGEDEGYASAVRLRERMVAGFRKLRKELDEFNPDFVVIWGDDQYENFREDIIPPFCVLAYDEFECKPFGEEGHATRRNVWDEPGGHHLQVPGTQGRRALPGVRHDRPGAWTWPMLISPSTSRAWATPSSTPSSTWTTTARGSTTPWFRCWSTAMAAASSATGGGSVEHSPDPDPPGPSPKRCMEIGKAAAQAIKESPYRVALIASSSWSHAFLTEKHHWLYPDIESDRARFAEMKDGDYQAWARISTPQIEDAGQQELLNWACLVGAVDELGYKADIVDWYETYIFNSTKCLAVFK